MLSLGRCRRAGEGCASTVNMLTKGRFALHVSLTCILLAACATTPPATLPVPVTCVPANTPVKPSVHTPEELAKAPTGADRYMLMASDYLKLYARSLITEPVIEGCRQAGK